MQDVDEHSFTAHRDTPDQPFPCASEKGIKPTLDGIPEQSCPTLLKESASDPVDGHGSEVRISWTVKVPALACILFFTLGSTYCQSSLPPLKSTLKAQIQDVNNSRYGAISSSDHLINGVLLIFSGIAIDYYGPILAGLVSSTFVVLGAIVRAVGGQKASFPIILGGQILSGIGSKTLETVQSKLYSHWFRGDTKRGRGWIGLVTGLDMAFGRLFSLMGNATAIPIANGTGQWYWAFWIGAILSAFALLLIVIYLLLEKSLPESAQLMTGRRYLKQIQAQQPVTAHDNPTSHSRPTSLLYHWRLLTYSILNLPASFWLLAITQILQAGVAHAYTSNLSEVVQVTRGTTKLVAGYTSAIGEIVPIIMTPVFGICFDLFGRRMWLVSATALLWILVFSLLAYTNVHPMIPVVLGSLALSSNAIPFIASIPLLVSSQESIGTAYGIWRSFNSSGITITDVSVGAIQDRTPKGDNQYNGVFYFLIALKAVDVLYGLIYDFLDIRFFGSVLRLNEQDRLAKESQESEADRLQGLRPARRRWTAFGLLVLVVLIATSYVLYVVYSMKS